MSSAPVVTPSDLIQRALRSHPQIAQRQAERHVAESEIDAARLQYYPTPSVTVSQARGDMLTTARLAQPLWAGGRIDAGLDAAVSREQIAQQDIEVTGRQLALRVINLWQQWSAAQARIRTAQKGLEQLNTYARSVERRLDGGFASKSDSALIVARIQQLQGDLENAQVQGRVALAQLNQAIGGELSGTELVIAKGPDADPSATMDSGLNATLSAAIAASPELQRIRKETAAAEADVRIKQGQRWPTLNLVAQHQRGNTRSLGASQDVNDSRLMLTLEYNPGAGLSAGQAAETAQRRLATLDASQKAARLDIIDKVRADFEEARSLRGRLAARNASIEANRAVLASFERLFDASRKNWLDVMNAARELIQDELARDELNAALAGVQWRLWTYAGRYGQASAVQPR